MGGGGACFSIALAGVLQKQFRLGVTVAKQLNISSQCDIVVLRCTSKGGGFGGGEKGRGMSFFPFIQHSKFCTRKMGTILMSTFENGFRKTGKETEKDTQIMW